MRIKTIRGTHPLSYFVNFMRQKVSVRIEVVVLELPLSNYFIGDFSFQIHEAFQHLIVGLATKQNSASVNCNEAD